MATAFQADAFQNNAFQVDGGPTPPAPTPTTEQASNWQVTHKRRLTEEELRALIREQRIALGILPPELPGQGIAEPAQIAKEVAEAVHNDVVMAEIPIDYATIYRQAYLEAEYAIAEYRKIKRKRKAAAFMLLH